MLDPMLRKALTTDMVREYENYRYEIIKKAYTPPCFQEMRAQHPTKLPEKCRRCRFFKPCYKDWHKKWLETQEAKEASIWEQMKFRQRR